MLEKIKTFRLTLKKENAKKTLQSKLSLWDLIMNEEKTEEFTIKRNGEETWKKCKLLGTLLDTEENVK